LPGGPGRQVGCVGLEGELGEAVRSVVDGDDAVGDDPVGVAPGVGVADPAERGGYPLKVWRLPL
jgi:hypothetical protein